MTDIKSWNGMATETQYPYVAQTNPCVRTAAMNNAPISGYTCLSNSNNNNLTASEVTMASFLAANGVLSIALDASCLFSYTSGVLPGTCGCTQNSLDHAINIVGYGTDPSAGPYWIVRNSWGTTWGMDGYFLLERGVNACGVATGVSFPLAI